MSARPMSARPSAPPKALLTEIEGLVDEIQAIHADAGRAVANFIKPARKGRLGLPAYEAEGARPSEDFRALYWRRNGVPADAPLSHWESEVFLGFHWRPIDFVTMSAAIARIENHAQRHRSTPAFFSSDGIQLALCPELAQNGETPLIATLAWGKAAFIAFDSTRAMLRAVVAAHRAGVVSFAPPLTAGAARAKRLDGREIEPHETLFDPGALWEVIAPITPRAEYWIALRDGADDWQGEPPDLPANGVLNLHPEVRRLIMGR